MCKPDLPSSSKLVQTRPNSAKLSTKNFKRKQKKQNRREKSGEKGNKGPSLSSPRHPTTHMGMEETASRCFCFWVLVGYVLVLASSSNLDPLAPPSHAALEPLLRERRAHKCWHKHSTFLDHLLSTSSMVYLWSNDSILADFAALHSVFGNSYVSLKLFDMSSSHDINLLSSSTSQAAVNLTVKMCSCDRQNLIVNTLLGSSIPFDGLTVPSLSRNTSLHFTALDIKRAVIFTVADVADQYFGWQDALFPSRGMISPGGGSISDAGALWPGDGRPGLWMSYASRLCNLAATYQTPETPDPPIFNNCSGILSDRDEEEALNLYWDVVINHTASVNREVAISKLTKCCSLNPYIAEPHVLLSQLHSSSSPALALHHSSAALEIFRQWGVAWDKRVSLDAWVAWATVINQRASDNRIWPETAWGVNNLGMVKDQAIL